MSIWNHNIYDNVRTRVLILQHGQIVVLPAVKASTTEVVWRLPGGGLEPGESLAECAAREVREETGLTVQIGGVAMLLEWVVPTYCHPPKAKPNQHGFGLEIYFYATPSGNLELKPETIEHGAPQWVDLEQLITLPFWPSPIKSLAQELAQGRQPAGIHTFAHDLEDPQTPPPTVVW